MIFTHEYTIYLLQVSKQFISFRVFGPSGNKLPGHLQQINVYIHLQKSRYCVYINILFVLGNDHYARGVLFFIPKRKNINYPMQNVL